MFIVNVEGAVWNDGNGLLLKEAQRKHMQEDYCH